jgi:hypothetical protein
MPNLTAWWLSGGPAMYAIAAFDLCGMAAVAVALIVAIFARVTGKARGGARIVAVLSFFLCLLPICAGLVGTQVPIEGNRTPLRFGGCSSLCFGLTAIAAYFVAPRGRRPWEDVE